MGVIGKVFPMTTIKKSRIYTAIYDKKNEIFDIDTVNKHVEECINRGVEDFSEIFSSVDLLQFIKCNSKLNKFFNCLFINGNYAWVSKDRRGHYRYFTRSKAEITFSLDFIDLFSIYLNAGFRKTIVTINKMFGVSFDDEWRLAQKQKYEDNKFLIENDEIIRNYPKLYSVIKNHLSILHAMNEIGDSNLIGKSLQCNNEAIFFSSTRYVKSNHNVKYSTSVINQVINLFSVLGLISKVSEQDIPAEYITMSKDRMKIDKCRYNHISFYTLPNMLDTLNEAEKRAEVLINHNIKYYSMSHYVVKRVFGEEFANQIYVQKVYGGVSKRNARVFADEKEKIKHYFSISVIENGFASKELLKKETEMNDKTFNKLWLELIDNVDHVTVRPNKSMKQRHKLITNENVIIVKEKYNVASF
jgi:hypothetical protein